MMLGTNLASRLPLPASTAASDSPRGLSLGRFRTQGTLTRFWGGQGRNQGAKHAKREGKPVELHDVFFGGDAVGRSSG